MDIFKFATSSRREDVEEDFFRVEADAEESSGGEDGAGGQAEGGDASGGESSFSLGSGKTPARMRSGVGSRVTSHAASPTSPSRAAQHRRQRSGVGLGRKSSVVSAAKDDEKDLWPFWRAQFLRPKKLQLEKESFLDGEAGLEYLLREMDKQAREAPIVRPDDAVHNQDHLAGWKYGAKDCHTLAQWRAEAKEFDGQSEQDILKKHFARYLAESVFNLKERPHISSFTEKNKAALNLASTTMETVRLGGLYYLIVSGHLPGTLQQGIQIHKYSAKQNLLELIHEVQLNAKPLQANPEYAKTWAQNGGYIYYFEVQNQVQRELIKFTLFKYDLVHQKEIWVQEYQTSMQIVTRHSGERDPQLAAGVLWGHTSLDASQKNRNEHEEMDEQEFLDAQFLCVTSEYFIEAEGHRLMYQIRALKDFGTALAEEYCSDRLQTVRAVFLHLRAAQHESHDILVVSVNGGTKMWYIKAAGGGNELEHWPSADRADHEHAKELQHQIHGALGRLAATQYYYYDNVQDRKHGGGEIDPKAEPQAKTYLCRSSHQLPTEQVDLDPAVKGTLLAVLYERQLHVARQRMQISTLLDTFIVEPKGKRSSQVPAGAPTTESLGCINANMIYDLAEDHYILILKSSDGNLHAVTGQRDERRLVHSGPSESRHPYEVAANANATGLKQLDKNFGNVFIQQYKDRDRDEWLQSVVYIDEEGVAHSQSSANEFDLVLARLKSGYHLYGKLNDNDCWQAKRLELAEDDRVIRPRINCQFGEGLFIELYDCQADKVWKRQKVQILFDASQRQIDYNEALYASQQLTQSSNVYVGRYEGEYCQDYQWCFIGPSKLWAKILEYRVGWTPAHPERSRLVLVGFKLIIFRNVYPALGNHLGPLFNSNYEIDGTQWNLKDFKIQLPRFREHDFQFHRGLASSGYKKYYLKGDLQRVHSILFETRLSQRIQENAAMFSPVERLSIMEQQVRTLMNMVPHDMQTWRTHLDNISGSSFEFFQPLENLRGQSTADFFISDPDVLQKKIKTLGKDRTSPSGQKTNHHQPSLLGEFLEQLTPKNRAALHDDLRSADFQRQDYECCKDLYGHDTLLKCFDGDELQVTASRILLDHFMTLEKSVSAQRMMMVMIPYVLESEDDYDGLADFFIALKGGNPELENTAMSYAQHLKVFELPHFSDEEFHMEQFTLGELNRTNLSTFITNNILTRFKAKDHQKLQIPVEHFSVEFLSQRLHYKMKLFWSGQELRPYEMTEYDLAQTLSQIVNKYDYKIERYTSVRFMVDCQFATTHGFFRFQCALYLCGFFVPMMMQIFLLADSPWLVRLCLLSCLATSCFFLGLEYLQLQDVGWATYAGDFYNIVDMAMFLTYVTYFLLRMADPASALLPLQQGAHALSAGTDQNALIEQLNSTSHPFGAISQHSQFLKGRGGDSGGTQLPTHGSEDALTTDALAYLYAMALLNSAMVVQGFLKVMFFLRIHDGFGLLVDLVAECLVDAVPFTVFLMMWVGLFTVLFRLQGLEIAADDYDQLGPMAIYTIQTYRNSVGDIAAPAYSFWSAQEAHPMFKYSMIGIIWSTWFLNQFFLTIILLNFLIAILAESFNTVMACAAQHKYKQRVGMNRETFITLKAFGMLQPFEGFVLTANCSKGRQAEDPLADAVDAVAETQQEIKEELSELKSQLGEVLGKVGGGAAGDGSAALANQVAAELKHTIKQLMPSSSQKNDEQIRSAAEQAPNGAVEAVRAEVAQVKAQGEVLREDLQAVRGEMSELKGLMQSVLVAMPPKRSAREEQKIAREADSPTGSQRSGIADHPSKPDADVEPTEVISRPRNRTRANQPPSRGNALLNLKEAQEEE